MSGELQSTDLELAELVRRVNDAADAYIRGDIHHDLSLFDHGHDHTLMPPYGGPTTHGFEYTEEGAAETSGFAFARHASSLSSPMSQARWSCWWASSVSAARSAGFPTRTGHCE